MSTSQLKEFVFVVLAVLVANWATNRIEDAYYSDSSGG